MKLAVVLPHLNEKQRRILAAAEAKTLGRGGIQHVANITGLSRPTLYRGLRDIDEAKGKAVDISRVREAGGGRKKLTVQSPEIIVAIEKLIDPSTRGDPESPLRWTCKSIRALESELNEMGHEISYPSVAAILQTLSPVRCQYSMKLT